MNRIIIGNIYRHYKGDQYKVLRLANHTETMERYVVYEKLNSDVTWIRPEKMFLENVEVRGKLMPRFQLINEQIR